jgi:RNA polymerase sigma-70 factor (ECF subfamily)
VTCAAFGPNIFQTAGRMQCPLPLPAWLSILFGAPSFAATPRCESPILGEMSELDATDVAQARKGDGEAYRRIVLRHQQSLAKRMRRFARTVGDVDELVHETFVQAYLSLHTYSERAPFEHWLQSIATRVGYAYWKRRDRAKKIAHLEESNEIAATAAPPSPEEASATLHAVLEKLSPRDRMIITLLHLEERTVAEAAEHTGWSQTMVKVQAFRARGRLKKLLQQARLSEDAP